MHNNRYHLISSSSAKHTTDQRRRDRDACLHCDPKTLRPELLTKTVTKSGLRRRTSCCWSWSCIRPHHQSLARGRSARQARTRLVPGTIRAHALLETLPVLAMLDALGTPGTPSTRTTRAIVNEGGVLQDPAPRHQHANHATE